MRRVYPIVEADEGTAPALQVLALLASHGVRPLDPHRWLAVEVPDALTRQPSWRRIEPLLRQHAGGLALVARMIGMLAEANAPRDLGRRIRELSGAGWAVAQAVLGPHAELLSRPPEALTPPELDLLYAALAAGLAQQARGGR